MVVRLLAVGLLVTGCSSGPSAAQQQTAALRQLQVVLNDVNAVSSAQEEYAQDVQLPCPANLTPGTFPGYDCGGRPRLTASQLQQAKDAISKAKAQLAADERKCLSFIGELKNGKAGRYIVKKSSCEVSPGPAPRDSPAP